ncbi:MAG: GntR family transcriptional regulator [Acidobacteriota bacterium]
MRFLRIDPSDPAPIWSQIERNLRRLVASSALAPGEAVPSVRDLAKDLRVNPATVAKAYQRLADAGILAVRRGDGTYVAEKPPLLARGERDRTLRDGASTYAALAGSIGATQEQAEKEIAAAWRNQERTLAKAPPGKEKKEE